MAGVSPTNGLTTYSGGIPAAGQLQPALRLCAALRQAQRPAHTRRPQRGVAAAPALIAAAASSCDPGRPPSRAAPAGAARQQPGQTGPNRVAGEQRCRQRNERCCCAPREHGPPLASSQGHAHLQLFVHAGQCSAVGGGVHRGAAGQGRVGSGQHAGAGGQGAQVQPAAGQRSSSRRCCHRRYAGPLLGCPVGQCGGAVHNSRWLHLEPRRRQLLAASQPHSTSRCGAAAVAVQGVQQRQLLQRGGLDEQPRRRLLPQVLLWRAGAWCHVLLHAEGWLGQLGGPREGGGWLGQRARLRAELLLLLLEGGGAGELDGRLHAHSRRCSSWRGFRHGHRRLGWAQLQQHFLQQADFLGRKGWQPPRVRLGWNGWRVSCRWERRAAAAAGGRAEGRRCGAAGREGQGCHAGRRWLSGTARGHDACGSRGQGRAGMSNQHYNAAAHRLLQALSASGSQLNICAWWGSAAGAGKSNVQPSLQPGTDQGLWV